MIEVSRGLQPLREAEGAIAKLQDYESSAELASALQATNAAVQRSLRYLLRADRGAPDDVRLAALSPSELTPDRLIPALRQRNLISLELAGMIHELELASGRAANGNVRAADGDLALKVVDQLTAGIQSLGERDMREVAHATVASGALDEPAHTVPPPRARSDYRRIVLIAGAVLLVTLLAWLVLRPSELNRGIDHFEARRYAQAEQSFTAVLDDNPADPVAVAYLARIYRRSNRVADAGRLLQRAIEENPNDALLRHEMGNVFMDLNQPQSAVRQYRQAQELDADHTMNWVQLVRALRALGDPEAEIVLQRAPEEARALLRSAR